MQRSNNDMDKLLDLFLYLFPKYLNKISDPRNNRYVEKRPYINKNSERYDLQEYKIEDINDDDHHNNRHTNEKEENKDNSSSTNDKGKDSNKEDNSSSGDKHDSNIDCEEVSRGEALISDNESEVNEENSEGLKENKGVSKGGEVMPDAVDVIDIAKEDALISESTDEINYTGKNQSCNICVDGIEKILIELVGEKVDICITNPTMFLLNAVTILNAADGILKLKTSFNTIIVIPIEEIVAIRCNLIYGINFQENCDLEPCKKEDGLRRYFTLIIGKKVSIQTKGEGEFKYISNKIVTGTGKGIVIIEGTIAISLSKITLVEEIK